MKFMCDICKETYDRMEDADRCEKGHRILHKLGLACIYEYNASRRRWVWHRYLAPCAYDRGGAPGVEVHCEYDFLEFQTTHEEGNSDSEKDARNRLLDFASKWLSGWSIYLKQIMLDGRVEDIDDWDRYIKQAQP